MSDPKNEARIMMTTRIWGITVALLGICIPLIGIERDLAALPMLVIVSTMVSTVVIWRSSRSRSDEMLELNHSIRELQRQIAHMQISSTDDELKQKIERLTVK